MQGDQENYLHFKQITVCEQEQTITLEMGQSENRKGDEWIHHIYGSVRLLTNLTTDVIASNLSFRQCALIIVVDMQHNYDLSSFSVFLCLRKCTGLSWLTSCPGLPGTEKFPEMQDLICYNQENPVQVGISWSPWLLSPRHRITAHIPRLFWGARMWHVSKALPFRIKTPAKSWIPSWARQEARLAGRAAGCLSGMRAAAASLSSWCRRAEGWKRYHLQLSWSAGTRALVVATVRQQWRLPLPQTILQHAFGILPGSYALDVSPALPVTPQLLNIFQ